MTHAGHEVAGADAASGGEGVAGVAEVVEVEAVEAGEGELGDGRPPLGKRVEVARRIRAPVGPVKTRAERPRPAYWSMCVRRSSRTAAGRATVRMPARDFGGPAIRPWPLTSTKALRTRTCPGRGRRRDVSAERES